MFYTRIYAFTRVVTNVWFWILPDDLKATTGKLALVVEFGISQLRATAVKPRVKPWVDIFNTTSHDIKEVDYSFTFEILSFLLHSSIKVTILFLPHDVGYVD